MNNDEFQIRPYSKRELAMLYSPMSTISAARSKLSAWIHDDPEIYRRLRAAGYTKRQHLLTPRQVQIIVDYLGIP